MRNEIMRSEIGRLLKGAREEKNLTRDEVCAGVMAAEELRLLEDGENDWDFWEVTILLRRLQVPDSAVSFYLYKEDNDLVNLEEEIRLDLNLWRYEAAEAKLKEYDQKSDKKNELQMMEYWQMCADLAVCLGRQLENEDVFKKFAAKKLPFLEERLHTRGLLSPDELAFITSYYQLTIKDTAERMKKLYPIVNYFQTEFATTKENYPFYAILMFAYAQCQYKLGEYKGCIRECEEGLRVTVSSRHCKTSGKLYELMADAKGKRMEEEGLEESEKERRVKEILQDYALADTLYSLYYHNYKGDYEKKLMKKIEKWKTTISG